MNDKIIGEISEMVEGICRSKINLFGYGIWTHHILPMVKIAGELAGEYGADAEIVAISALLRGLTDGKGGDQKKGEGPQGLERAEEILELHRYPKDGIVMIRQCLAFRGSGGDLAGASVEELCVADADAMAHIQEIGSLFYVVYKEMNLDIDEGIRWIQGKISRDWDAMSDRGKAKFRGRYEQIQNDIMAISAKGREGA